MQFSLFILPQEFLNFLNFQAFGVSGAAFLVFIILTFIVIPVFFKLYLNMKNKTKKDFFGMTFILLVPIWLISFSTIMGPFFFNLINYKCTSYEATSCFLTSVVAVVIGFMGVNYAKKETEKIGILENASVKMEGTNTWEDSNKHIDGLEMSLYE